MSKWRDRGVSKRKRREKHLIVRRERKGKYKKRIRRVEEANKEQTIRKEGGEDDEKRNTR